MTGKIELQYELMSDLTITSRLGYTYVDIYSKNFNPFVYYGAGHNATNANEDLTPIVTIDGEGNVTSTHNRVSESHTNFFNYISWGYVVIYSSCKFSFWTMTTNGSAN